MNRIYSYIGIVLLALSLSSCLKEDPIEPPVRADDVQSAMIEMSPTYPHQFYYSLEKGEVVSFNHYLDYDLMFDSRSSSHAIWLNPGRNMRVANLGAVPFETSFDEHALSWSWDPANGDADSNAIGKWWTGTVESPVSLNQLYIIDRGVSIDQQQFGRVRFMITRFDPVQERYTIRFADLDNGTTQEVIVSKDKTCNFSYLLLSGAGEIAHPEPGKDTWDLWFTRYVQTFYDPEYLAYHVTGVFTNPSKVTGMASQDIVFSEVDLTAALEYTYFDAWDVVGYNWKYFDVNSFTYFVYDDLIYVLKTGEHNYYKLRFVSFTNDQGQFGYPQFEFQQL